jgi:hypothetical protein
LYGLGSDIISSGLKELNISWPFGFSVISEHPGFSKFDTGLNFMFVGDAFLDEASLISWVLWLLGWSWLLDLHWLILLE